jgi:streptogramin lyase
MGGSYVEAVVASGGFSQIAGIAVDSSKNVYVSDIDVNQVYKETLSGGTYTQSTVPTNGLGYPYDVAVDSSGDLYIADFSNQRIVKEKFLAGSYAQSVYPTSALPGSLGVAVDASGVVYIANTFGQAIWKSSPAGGNFGPINVGTACNIGYLVFRFVGSGTLAIAGDTVLTQGASGLDYSDIGSGSCAAATYNPGDSCAVSVQFMPQAPGPRLGAGQLLDSSNNILATGYISGSGVGPQVNFLPGTESVVAVSCDLNPQGMAVDASGNVFFADFFNDEVFMVSPLGVRTTVATSDNGMSAPESVAVDGAGNLYIADSQGDQILKGAPSSGGYVFDAIANSCENDLTSPGGVALDGHGNVFVADAQNSRILMETPGASNYTQSIVPTSGLSQPFAVAVDFAGSLYIPDLGNNQVVKLTLTAGVYHQGVVAAGCSEPTSVFVDVNGNVFVGDYGNNRVGQETLSAGSYTQSVVATSALSSPYGVALDGSGNIYVTDVADNRVINGDVADPPASLAFASANVCTQSSDSPQSLTLLNFGDAALSLSVPGSGTNPTFSTASFTLDGSTTGPEVSPIDAPGATQTILVSGTGLSVAPPATTVLTLTAVPVATSPFGQSVTLSANLLPFADGGQSTNGELVTFENGAASLGTGTLASGVASLTLTTLPAGVDSLTAAYAGDLNFAASTSAAISCTVTRITPMITWATPAQITFGTALASTQLDATSLVAGTFVYTPAAETTPAAGIDTLSVTFTPTDTVTYSNATSTVTLAVFDLAITATGGASPQSVSPGAAATFPFTAAPEGALTFPNPVTSSVTGLPPGATAVFTPATIPAGSPSTPVSLVVQTTISTAAVMQIPSRLGPVGNAPVELALLFLPILGLQAFRKRLRLSPSTRAAVLLATLAVGAVVGFSGCTGTTHSNINSTSYPPWWSPQPVERCTPRLT